jgi:hypothetical protein
MDEIDEINLGVVQTEYERERERLNEPTNSGCSGCAGILLFVLLGIAVIFIVVRLLF